MRNATWVEGAFLVLVDHPCNDGVDVLLHRPAHLFLSGWLKLNLFLSLGQLRLTSGNECLW